MFSCVGRGLYESALDMLMWTTTKGVLFLQMNKRNSVSREIRGELSS